MQRLRWRIGERLSRTSSEGQQEDTDSQNKKLTKISGSSSATFLHPGAGDRGQQYKYSLASDESQKQSHSFLTGSTNAKSSGVKKESRFHRLGVVTSSNPSSAHPGGGSHVTGGFQGQGKHPHYPHRRTRSPKSIAARTAGRLLVRSHSLSDPGTIHRQHYKSGHHHHHRTIKSLISRLKHSHHKFRRRPSSACRLMTFGGDASPPLSVPVARSSSIAGLQMYKLSIDPSTSSSPIDRMSQSTITVASSSEPIGILPDHRRDKCGSGLYAMSEPGDTLSIASTSTLLLSPSPSVNSVRSAAAAGLPAGGGSAGRQSLSRRSSFASQTQELQDCSWYWGPVSRATATQMLEGCSNGSFLVRDSQSSVPTYLFCLSFKSHGQVLHARISLVCSGRYYTLYPADASTHCSHIHSHSDLAVASPQSGLFPSVASLVQWLLRSDSPGLLCTVTQGEGTRPDFARVRLSTPVPRTLHVQTLASLAAFVIRRFRLLDEPLPGDDSSLLAMAAATSKGHADESSAVTSKGGDESSSPRVRRDDSSSMMKDDSSPVTRPTGKYESSISSVSRNGSPVGGYSGTERPGSVTDPFPRTGRRVLPKRLVDFVENCGDIWD